MKICKPTQPTQRYTDEDIENECAHYDALPEYVLSKIRGIPESIKPYVVTACVIDGFAVEITTCPCAMCRKDYERKFA